MAAVEPACGPIDAWLGNHRQVLVGIRRHLHMHPEPSGQERETTGYLAERLGELIGLLDGAGYTPFEQLQSRGNVGPWSDLYALGATVAKASRAMRRARSSGSKS